MRDWFEYELKLAREEAAKNALQQGSQNALQDSILEFLQEYGTIPNEVVELVRHQEDTDILKKWNKIAARVGSVEKFMEQAIAK